MCWLHHIAPARTKSCIYLLIIAVITVVYQYPDEFRMIVSLFPGFFSHNRCNVSKLELLVMKRKLFAFLKKHLLLTGLLSAVILAVGFVVGIYFISFLLGPPDLMNEQNTVIYSNDQEIIGEEKGIKSLDKV